MNIKHGVQVCLGKISHLFYRLALVLGLMLGLLACADDSQHTAGISSSDADTDTERISVKASVRASVKEVRHSVARSGAAIDVRIRAEREAVQGQPLQIILQLHAAVGQAFWLEIQENPSYHIEGESRRLLRVTEGSPLIETLRIMPQSAGKHYLRMTVTDKQTGLSRPLVHVLKVRDTRGELPVTTKPQRDRIEFNSRPQ